jgi:hypothetical protein
MTNEEWLNSQSASDMLAKLHAEQPRFLKSQIRNVHRFLIACCWKHGNLIPQEGLRNGLRGAEQWLAGEIGDDELNRLNWHAEADAFLLDYGKEPEDIVQIKALIDSIDEVRDLPFKQARKRLLDGAYFAEGAMIYPLVTPLPWWDRMFTSEFLCPHLLREHIKPDLP